MDGIVAELVAERLAAGASCVLTVRTGSMAPLLRPGDAVLVAPLAGRRLHRGMLLVVRQGDYLVTHRLIGWAGCSAERWLLLQGDACSQPDRPVPCAAAVGCVVSRLRAGRWATVPSWLMRWPVWLQALWLWHRTVLTRS